MQSQATPNKEIPSDSTTKTTTNKKKKTFYNDGDTRYAFVKWNSEKDKFSVVPMSDLEKSEAYILEESYKIRWFNSVARTTFTAYTGKLIFIGTEHECEEKEIQATTHLQDKGLSGKINKGPSEKVAQITTEKLIEESKIHQLEQHIKNLEIKLKEKDTTNSTLVDENAQLKKNLSELQTKQSNNEKIFEFCSREKLLAIAKCIYSHLGTGNDLEDLSVDKSLDDQYKMVLLSARFPEIKIPLNLKLTLESMKNNEKHTTSKIYRCLINGLLANVDAIQFGNSNAEILSQNFNRIINACSDYMQNIDFDKTKKHIFTQELQNKCLRELCSEARQKKWLEDPSFVFNVGGNELKKSNNNNNKKRKRKSKNASKNASDNDMTITGSNNDNQDQIQAQVHPQLQTQPEINQVNQQPQPDQQHITAATNIHQHLQQNAQFKPQNPPYLYPYDQQYQQTQYQQAQYQQTQYQQAHNPQAHNLQAQFQKAQHHQAQHQQAQHYQAQHHQAQHQQAQHQQQNLYIQNQHQQIRPQVLNNQPICRNIPTNEPYQPINLQSNTLSMKHLEYIPSSSHIVLQKNGNNSEPVENDDEETSDSYPNA
jgi:hypothetical protein